MAEIKCRVLYDFESAAGSGELTIRTGEILTVVRQDIGDGWWEAKNHEGIHGLIPEAYVEPISIPEPSMPPPPVPLRPRLTPLVNSTLNNHHDELNNHATSNNGAWTTPQETNGQPAAGGFMDDDWGDDWSDDDDISPDPSESASSGRSGYPPSSAAPSLIDHPSYMTGFGGSGGGGALDTMSMSGRSTVGKSGGRFNRFSAFVKSGGEAYLLGTSKPASTDANDAITVVEDEFGPRWQPNQSPYTCAVSSPRKENKYHGIKSYISYAVTPSFSNIQVSRRYKHFDWLHERLINKFTTICIPPLPEKQVTGRYEEEFIEGRMRQLQMWVDRMVRHPVISTSSVFKFFLTCTDEKRWKEGKRKAEKDGLIGGSLFLSVKTPTAPLDAQDTENQVESFKKFAASMGESVHGVMAISQDMTKRMQTHYKNQYQKAGAAFLSLANSFPDSDMRPGAQELKIALRSSAEAYCEIGNIHEEQPKLDWIPMIEHMIEYKGMLSTFPDIIHVQKSTASKVAECQRAYEDGKLTDEELQQVTSRGDTISYAVLAEMDTFETDRLPDFRDIFKSFLQEQIGFHQKIAEKLEESLAHFERL